MTFADLGLKPELLRALVEKGYTIPTPIQAQAIPAVLTGGDVLAGAQTGTGKTAAFVLPILQKLGQSAGRAPRALVLTPTRELAAQVAESARTYGRYAGLRTVVVFGGVSINPQIDSLHSGCDLLVATPGRLLDLVEQRALDLRSVQIFVLDEADRMLDMGFIPAIRRVVKLLPTQRQNLMFSATYSDDIRELAGRILRNPVNIEVSPRNATAERVDQHIYRVSKENKRHLLAHLIDDGNWHQVLVFTRTKHGANRLSQQLESNGIRAAAIHGNKSQGARVRALSDFKANKITALVATEVAARGLDIKELPHVVNYELPNVPEDYVHRIGRTARAGGSGCAVSLVSPDEAPLLKDIERMLKRSLPVAALPEFEIVAAPAAPRSDSDSPVRRNGGRSGRPSHSGRHGNGGGQRAGQGRGAGDARGNSGRTDHAPRADHSGRHGNGGGQRAGQGLGSGDVQGNSGRADHAPRADYSGQPGNGGGQRAGEGHGAGDRTGNRGGYNSAGGGRGTGGRHGNGGGHARPGQQPRRFSSGGQRPRASGGRSSGGR